MALRLLILHVEYYNCNWQLVNMSGIYEYAVVWIELLYVPGRGLLFGILVLNPPTHLLHNEPGVTEADPLPSVCVIRSCLGLLIACVM